MINRGLDAQYSISIVIIEIGRANFPKYTIMRLGNINFGKNPRTLLNHLRIRKALGKPLDIQNVYRYIVDKEELLHWINLIPSFSCEMNVPGRRMLVADIVREFV